MIKTEAQDKYCKDGIWTMQYSSDDVLFRKWKCLIVNAEVVACADDAIVFEWHSRNVVIKIAKEIVLSYPARALVGDPIRFRGMQYHYVPLRDWQYVKGDAEWLTKLKLDYKWDSV